MNAPTNFGRASFLAAAVCTVIATAGCGEVMFKRGAGPGDMSNAQADCRKNAKDEDAYAGCMRAAGYVYEKPTTEGVLFVAPTPVEAEPATAGVPAAAGESDASSIAAGAALAPSPAPGQLTATVEPAARAGESVAKPKPAPKLPADPLAQVNVASWWKLGGSAGGLDADQASCAEKLGEAHKTAPNAKRVTVGMVSCLRGKGWFAVGQ
ncbi:MAG: hypothetical protein AB7I01_02250 [Gammaproteobacteria bacterium]